MSDIDTDQDAAFLARIGRQGFKLVHEEFGRFPNGKSTRANALADRLRDQGQTVYVDDGIWSYSRNAGGVRVYAKG